MLPNLELEESLIDKSANSFTSLPEFAELVALVNKFGDLLALTPFTYFDLELALQQEEQQQTQKSTEAEASHPLEHNPLIENFVAEVLHFFSKYDSVHMQKKLYWLIVGINRWSFPTFDARLLLPPKEESKMKELIKTNSKLDMGMESEEESEADEEGKSTTESGSRDHSVNNNKRTTTIAPTCMDSTQIQVIPNHHKSRNVLKPDYLNLSTVNKLKLFCFLVDAQLACAHDSDVHDLLDQDFSCDQQRITPLVIDSTGRKFWYFCDTWLFLEEEKLLIAEEEDRKIQVKICDDQLREKVETHKQSNKKNGRKVKSPKKKNEEVVRIHQQELDEIYADLFTGRQLRVICKCSDHFTQLINAYKGQRNAKQNEWVVEKLEECWKTVQNIENERMKLLLAEQSRKSFSPMRQSSRIALLLERRRKEEAERKVKETAIEQERKRIEKEQMEFLQEHRRLTDSDLQLCGLSREERLKQRQQRIQDQYERDQLIEAGLLTPSPSAAATEDLDEEMSDEYEQEPYDNRKRRPITNGIDSKIKLLVPKNKRAQQHLTKGEVRPIPRLPAYDWWTPASTPSNDSNSTGLFQSLVHMKKPLQMTGLPRQQPTLLNRSMDKRMSLIAPSNADSSYVYNGKTLEEGNARTSRPRMPRFAPSLMNIRNALNLNSTNGTSSSAVKKEEVQKEETGASSATPLFEQQQPSEWQITEKRQPTPLIFRWAPVNPATVLTTENDGQTIADVKMENF